MREILKAIQVKTAPSNSKSYRLSDGEGLSLLVGKTGISGKPGIKSWQYRYRIGGNAKVLTIGKYPALSLKDARARHLAASKLVEDDICPIKHKQQAERVRERAEKLANRNSFEAVAREWFERDKHKWKSDKHRYMVLRSLKEWVFPRIGSTPITEVETADIVEVIEEVIGKDLRYETASRTLQRIGKVYKYAIALRRDLGIRTNPADGIAEFIIVRPPEQRDRHHPALEPGDMPQFLTDYAKARIYPQTRIATRLLMLTAVRTSELIEAEWSEFDLDNCIWTIPAARMKLPRDHVVPLSRQAIESIEQARLYRRRSKFLLPGRNSIKKSISNNTILFSIYDIGYKGRMTGHGFRSVFSTYLNSLKTPAKDNREGRRIFNVDSIEMQLAHVSGDKTRKAYDRNQYLDERIRLMQFWADTCVNWEGISRNVIPIHKTA